MAHDKWRTGLAWVLAVSAIILCITILVGSHFEWHSRNGKTRVTLQIGTENSTALNTVSVIVLVLGVAFLSAFLSRRLTGGEQRNAGPFLRQLAASETDAWIGGVCGGLGEHTPIPSWLWRLAFVILFFAYGTGLLAYIVLWIFLPAAKDPAKTTELPNSDAVPNR
jgi:phage shock protein C